MGDIIVDVIPRAAIRFLRANPTIEDGIKASGEPFSQYHYLLLEYLKNNHRTVSSYSKQNGVPEGKSPALLIVLDGIPGSFMLLTDRVYDDGRHYQAVRFDSGTRNSTDGERVTALWYARHVLQV